MYLFWLTDKYCVVIVCLFGFPQEMANKSIEVVTCTYELQYLTAENNLTNSNLV